MARTTHKAAEAPEPGLIFGEFYDAALATPELAVYVIRVGENGAFTFEDANDVVARVSGLPLSEIPRPDASRSAWRPRLPTA